MLAKIIIAIIVLILFVLAIYFTYSWQHSQVTQRDQKITDLEQQLSKKQPQTNTSTNTPSSSVPVTPQTSYTSLKSVSIKLYWPQSNQKVSSPLAVIGEVPGNWSFEASFPVKLLDSKGTVIAQTPAQLLGDWMTSSLVPFSAKLTWTGTQTGKGSLVLQKDNPSGLAQNDDSVTIPVQF